MLYEVHVLLYLSLYREKRVELTIDEDLYTA